MVDVSGKDITEREAIAVGELHMSESTRRILFSGGGKKGDALATARIAGIQAVKKTPELIPLCHSIPVGSVNILVEEISELNAARVTTTVRTVGQTGAEMEALTGTTVALLTLYDMLKSLQKDMKLTEVRLIRKTGGKSGDVMLA